MRITSQSMDTNVNTNLTKASSQISAAAQQVQPSKTIESSKVTKATEKSNHEGSQAQKSTEVSFEKLTEAIDAVNEFLRLEKRSSQFVLHEGLDKYYVRLVDAETEEVVKEIPPERLLDAFYEMQKLAGMIVDEKI